MNLGAELVTAILDTGNLQPLLDAGFTLEWMLNPASGYCAVFTGEDAAAYRHILAHWQDHGKVITRRLFDRNFPRYEHGTDDEATVGELLEVAVHEVQYQVMRQLLGDSIEYLENQQIDQALALLSKIGPQIVATPVEPGFRILERKELDKLPEPEILIQNWLHLGALVSLWGKFSTAKSFLALDWACHVATNRPWQGHIIGRNKQENDEGEPLPHRVLFIAAEGGIGQRKRIAAWEHAYNKGKNNKGKKIKNIDFIVVPIQLTEEQAQQFLVKSIKDKLYSMVVVDTQARATVGLDENSAQDMGIVVEALYKMRDAFVESGTTIVLIHHANKAGTDRGSSAVPGAVDVQYRLVSESKADDPSDFDVIPGPFILSCSKPPKDSEMPLPKVITLDESLHSLVIVDTSEGEKAARGETTPKPVSAKHKRMTRVYLDSYAEEEDISPATAYRRLNHLVLDGLYRHVRKSESDEGVAYWLKLPGAKRKPKKIRHKSDVPGSRHLAGLD